MNARDEIRTSPRTLEFFPVPTASAVLALALFLIARAWFFLLPDAFTPYPESRMEYLFYAVDLRIKNERPEAQIVVQGTSRSMGIQNIPIGRDFWRTKDPFYNASQPLNTLWHMATLLRRNPELLAHTDLWIIDIVPYQLQLSYAWDATDRLFLRESRWPEKLTTDRNRARAIFDGLIPAYSDSHTPANWWRALRTLNASDETRYNAIRSTRTTNAFEKGPAEELRKLADLDPDKVRESFAGLLYVRGYPSRIQREALSYLVSSRPALTQLLFVHYPFRDDFAEIQKDETLTLARRETREIFAAHTSENVHLIWSESASDFGLDHGDFGGDGFHPSPSGIHKISVTIARWFLQLVLPDQPASRLPPAIVQD